MFKTSLLVVVVKITICWGEGQSIMRYVRDLPAVFLAHGRALVTYDTNAKCNPPLRTQADVDAIKAALADGTIDLIATDHAPHSQEERKSSCRTRRSEWWGWRPPCRW